MRQRKSFLNLSHAARALPVTLVLSAVCAAASATEHIPSPAVPRASDPGLEAELQRIWEATKDQPPQMLEIALLELRDRFDEPAHLGAIYATIARRWWGSGDEHEHVIRHFYLAAALELPVDPLTRCELYGNGANLPEALFIEDRMRPYEEEFVLRERHRLAHAKLEGLRWMLDHGVPRTPVSGTPMTIIHAVGPPEVMRDAAARNKAAREAQLREMAENAYTNKMAESRMWLTTSIVTLYKRFGDEAGHEELRRLAREALGPEHEEMVDRLLRAVKSRDRHEESEIISGLNEQERTAEGREQLRRMALRTYGRDDEETVDRLRDYWRRARKELEEAGLLPPRNESLPEVGPRD